MRDILISIVVPVYNLENYLNQCLKSILIQRSEHIEIILVDDGSQDSSLKICRKFEKVDARFKVYTQKNNGVSSARNLGIQKAIGKYLMFLDGDDFWDGTDWMQCLMNKIDERDSDIIYFKKMKLYDSGKLIYPNSYFNGFEFYEKSNSQMFEHFMKNGAFITSVYLACIKRDIIIENSIFFKVGKKNTEDIEWFLTIFPYLKSFDSLSEVFYVYRVLRPNSATSLVGLKGVLDLINTIEVLMIKFADESIKNEIFSYLSYLLSQAIGLTYNLGDTSHKELLAPRIKKIIYLLEYTKFKKGRWILVIYKIFGLNILSMFLGAYIKKNNKGLI